MGIKAIELPVNKLKVFSRFSNLIKCSLKYRIVFRPNYSILKVIIKLLKFDAFYIFFNNILGVIYI